MLQGQLFAAPVLSILGNAKLANINPSAALVIIFFLHCPNYLCYGPLFACTYIGRVRLACSPSPVASLGLVSLSAVIFLSPHRPIKWGFKMYLTIFSYQSKCTNLIFSVKLELFQVGVSHSLEWCHLMWSTHIPFTPNFDATTYLGICCQQELSNHPNCELVPLTVESPLAQDLHLSHGLETGCSTDFLYLLLFLNMTIQPFNCLCISYIHWWTNARYSLALTHWPPHKHILWVSEKNVCMSY